MVILDFLKALNLKCPFFRCPLTFRTRPHAYQRGTEDGQAEVDREWKVLTSLFLNKWNEVTEESLAAKVRSTALLYGVVAPTCR